MVWLAFTPLFDLPEKKFFHCRTSEEEIPEFTYLQTLPTDSSDKLTLPGTTRGYLGGITAQPSPSTVFHRHKVAKFGKDQQKYQKENQNWVQEKKENFSSQ